MSLKRIAVIGAGGFAREVKWLIEEINAQTPVFEFVGYFVSDLSRIGEHDSRDEIRGTTAWLRENRSHVDALAIGIGTPAARLNVSRELAPEFPPEFWPALIHPSVRYDRATCQIGHGVIIGAGSIATVYVRCEPFSMVNLSCTIGHESVIRRGSVLNPTVNISGGVDIGEGVLVGTGAQVLQYLSVGKGATVGGGAVVTKDVPPGVTVVGMPAKPLAPRQPREAVSVTATLLQQAAAAFVLPEGSREQPALAELGVAVRSMTTATAADETSKPRGSRNGVAREEDT
jgi:sugar O-acyltransferase (sialic acid O-acetyltransferase NeuD family)